MSVLVEGLSVIVQNTAIDRCFPRGWREFASLVGNKTLCRDKHLSRVGFMTPTDVGLFNESLFEYGLVFVRNDQAVDLSVVDQRTGPTVSTPWLKIGECEIDGGKVRVCWLASESHGGVAVPHGWRYEQSLTANSQFVVPSESVDRLEFLRRDGGLDVYFDKDRQKEVYVGRSAEGEDYQIAQIRLEALCHEVIDIDHALRPLLLARDEQGTVAYFHRLNDDLYPEIHRIATSPTHAEDAFGQYVLGITLRTLHRREEAEVALRRANMIQPGVINILLELCRCLGEMDKSEAALEVAQEAARIEPNDPAALGNLAMSLSGCGQHKRARQVIKEALKIEPKNLINLQMRDIIKRNARGK